MSLHIDETIYPIDEANSESIREQAGRIAVQLQRVCHDTVDFIQAPGFPSAIRFFALTHSRRNIVER